MWLICGVDERFIKVEYDEDFCDGIDLFICFESRWGAIRYWRCG